MFFVQVQKLLPNVVFLNSTVSELGLMKLVYGDDS
jgi:hypothetical protein